MEETADKQRVRVLEAIRLSYLQRFVAADPGLGLLAEALQTERAIRQMGVGALLAYTQEIQRRLERQIARVERREQ